MRSGDSTAMSASTTYFPAVDPADRVTSGVQVNGVVLERADVVAGG
jgi:hypothetical protein